VELCSKERRIFVAPKFSVIQIIVEAELYSWAIYQVMFKKSDFRVILLVVNII
jgi:hypothetical protein